MINSNVYLNKYKVKEILSEKEYENYIKIFKDQCVYYREKQQNLEFSSEFSFTFENHEISWNFIREIYYTQGNVGKKVVTKKLVFIVLGESKTIFEARNLMVLVKITSHVTLYLNWKNACRRSYS
jgi:hypothetical protein